MIKIVVFKFWSKIIKVIAIHQRDVPVLMTQVYETVKGKPSLIVKNLFLFREDIGNIRNFQIIVNENKNTARYGLGTICYKAPSLFVGKST